MNMFFEFLKFPALKYFFNNQGTLNVQTLSI